jgi:hypothetical protein
MEAQQREFFPTTDLRRTQNDPTVINAANAEGWDEETHWPFGEKRVTQSELGSVMQPPDSLLPVRNGCSPPAQHINLRNRCHYRLNPETGERVYSRIWDVLVAAGTCSRASAMSSRARNCSLCRCHQVN